MSARIPAPIPGTGEIASTYMNASGPEIQNADAFLDHRVLQSAEGNKTRKSSQAQEILIRDAIKLSNPYHNDFADKTL